MDVFELLCDNTLAEVLLSLDFRAAARLSSSVSKSLRKRVLSADQESFLHVWQEIYRRHRFSPLESSNVYEELKERRRLYNNLIPKRKRNKSCFNLPNRYFHFLPVVPGDQDEDLLTWHDAPALSFDCPSFFLMSPGTSGEMVLLNPFDGSLAIHESCLDNAIASDDAMMEQAMTDAACVLRRRNSLGLDDLPDEHIAGAIIEESVYRNHNMEYYQTEPKEVLLDVEDYFNLDLSQYFRFDKQQPNNDELFLGRDEEVEIEWLGIDSAPIVREDDKVDGTMIAIVRQLSKETDGWSDGQVCTEIMAWEKLEGQELTTRYVCRFRWPCHSLFVCPCYKRIYVVFPFGEGPCRRHDIPEDHEGTDRFEFDGGSLTIAAYPLMQYSCEHKEKSGPRYFAKPLFVMRCKSPVVGLAGSAKRLLAGTTAGTIEIFDMVGDRGARRVKTVNILEALQKARKDKGFLESPVVDDSTEEQQTEESEPILATPGLPPNRPFETTLHKELIGLYQPPHHLDYQCGFATLHYKFDKGSQAVLWKKSASSLDFEVVSIVNLPLSKRKAPKVHFDGRRLIVFGKDASGMVILVYHVLNSGEDLAFWDKSDSHGVENFTEPGSLRFVNRIRHAALGGLEYDSIFLTCNERFIIVNTRNGNLLGGGSSPTADGLIVIDLQDQA